jgi:type IV pilus assembly protein PilO
MYVEGCGWEMKLTDRERVMLVILGIIAVIGLSYYFLFNPQIEKINTLLSEREKLREDVKRVQIETSPENKINKDLDAMNLKVGEKTRKFYPEILQDKIIVILDDILKKCQLLSNDAGFSKLEIYTLEVNKEEAAATYTVKDIVDEYRGVDSGMAKGNGVTQKTADSSKPAGEKGPAQSQNTSAGQNPADGKTNTQEKKDAVERMSATLQFSGTYDQLIQFVKAIESLDRTALVTKLTAADTATGGGNNQPPGIVSGPLKGTLTIDFYGLPKISQQDKEYFDWPYKNQYGKANPFAK